MPNTPYRGYYYPLFTAAAKVPDDLRRALEAVDADVEGLFQDLRIPIEGAIDHGDGTYSFVLSDGTVLEPIAQPIPPSNELTIGTVTTAGVGVPAEATIEGEPPNQVLSLVLPRGSGPNVTWDGTVIIVDGTRGPDLKSTVPGPTGKTAYEYAVDAGFEGTEEEFAEAQLPDTITWENIDDKPSTFPPEPHTHAPADVDGLESPLAALVAFLAAEWEPITTSRDDVLPASHGSPPAILRVGNWRFLRGRYFRTEDRDFKGGGNYGFLDLEPGDAPLATQGGMGQTTLDGYTRVEIAINGSVTGRPSRDTAWVGLDGVFWTIT